MSANEHVTETTRIISEDEVPPEILAEIRRKEASHADTVTKIINVAGTPNVGALMSALRPKVDKPTLEQRGSSLTEKLIHAGKALKEQRDERIRDKSKTLVDSVLKGLQSDESARDKNVPV